MFILKYHHFEVLHEVKADTFPEILEQCLNVINHNGYPDTVLEDDKIILKSAEIYKKLNKRYY